MGQPAKRQALSARAGDCNIVKAPALGLFVIIVRNCNNTCEIVTVGKALSVNISTISILPHWGRGTALAVEGGLQNCPQQRASRYRGCLLFAPFRPFGAPPPAGENLR